MTGNFHDILACIRARRDKDGHQYFVYYFVVKVANRAKMYGVTLDFRQVFAAKYGIAYRNRMFAR